MDVIEKLRNSVIQHGPFNDRIYLMKLSRLDMPGIVRDLNSFAFEKGYTKIFTRVPTAYDSFFVDDGYIKEAEIKGFYNSLNGASFFSKFLSDKRKKNLHSQEIKKVIDISMKKQNEGFKPVSGFEILRAEKSDAKKISEIYKEVFKTYPFPIQDEDYIRQTMKENIIYYKAEKDGRIAAVSSAETYSNWQAVEMTDFATLPEYLGNGLASMLLNKMEDDMRESSYLTAYTIARSLSPGMNVTFSKAGYDYCGTLINNTNISGSIQSMNIWNIKL